MVLEPLSITGNRVPTIFISITTSRAILRNTPLISTLGTRRIATEENGSRTARGVSVPKVCHRVTSRSDHCGTGRSFLFYNETVDSAVDIAGTMANTTSEPPSVPLCRTSMDHMECLGGLVRVESRHALWKKFEVWVKDPSRHTIASVTLTATIIAAYGLADHTTMSHPPHSRTLGMERYSETSAF